MKKKNELTSKDFWSNSWKKVSLPVQYSYREYAYQTIDKTISAYLKKDYKTFLEIGGCPGRWADYFFHKFNLVSDSMDYDENNIKITKQNYKLLKIKGRAFLGDITKKNKKNYQKYDVVLSDGLLEHFINSQDVFDNHLTYLRRGGLLIMGVPNIKKSWLYNHFAKKDQIAYNGYRHISRKELYHHAQRNNLKILFCNYIGVFNIGVVHSYKLSFITQKIFVGVNLLANFLLKMFKIKKETKIFSPYIYIIARKQ